MGSYCLLFYGVSCGFGFVSTGVLVCSKGAANESTTTSPAKVAPVIAARFPDSSAAHKRAGAPTLSPRLLQAEASSKSISRRSLIDKVLGPHPARTSAALQCCGGSSCLSRISVIKARYLEGQSTYTSGPTTSPSARPAAGHTLCTLRLPAKQF